MSEDLDQVFTKCPWLPYSNCYHCEKSHPCQACIYSMMYSLQWMNYYNCLNNNKSQNYESFVKQLYEQHKAYSEMYRALVKCNFLWRNHASSNCPLDNGSSQTSAPPEQTNEEPVNRNDEIRPIELPGQMNGDDVENNDWLDLSFKVLCGWFLTVLVLVNVTLPRLLLVSSVVLIVYGLKSKRRNAMLQNENDLTEHDQEDDLEEPSLLDSFLCFLTTLFSSLVPESLPVA